MNPKSLVVVAVPVIGAILLATGCAGSRSARQAQPASPPSAAAGVALIPGPTGAPPARAESDPPLYRPPKVGKVYLRAHVDANGRLIGPQVIYQIVEPGGWNLSALDHLAAEPPVVVDPDAAIFLSTPRPEPVAPAQGIQPTDAK